MHGATMRAVNSSSSDPMDITSLFPPQIHAVSATPDMWETPVFPEEEVFISQAMLKRQREFRAGRHCARAAMQQLGLPAQPILRDSNRAPLWPQGHLGSISHCRDFCIAACCTNNYIKGLGVDVEPIDGLKPGVEGRIHTQAESEFMHQHPGLPERLIFSAKESLYKSYYPLLKAFFGFQTVEIQVNPLNQTFHYRPTATARIQFPQAFRFHGRYLTGERHILTCCYLTPD